MFEYVVKLTNSFNAEEIAATANRMAAEGWRLISVQPRPDISRTAGC